MFTHAVVDQAGKLLRLAAGGDVPVGAGQSLIELATEADCWPEVPAGHTATVASGQIQSVDLRSTAEQAAAARSLRDALLTACDWTQLADVPAATRDAWAPYRQALREVPQQAGFPQAIEWPAAPI
jgi:hypothetical protein